MLISLPIVGEVLEPKHFKEVPIQVLVFISAATAIGKVGSEQTFFGSGTGRLGAGDR